MENSNFEVLKKGVGNCPLKGDSKNTHKNYSYHVFMGRLNCSAADKATERTTTLTKGISTARPLTRWLLYFDWLEIILKILVELAKQASLAAKQATSPPLVPLMT